MELQPLIDFSVFVLMFWVAWRIYRYGTASRNTFVRIVALALALLFVIADLILASLLGTYLFFLYGTVDSIVLLCILAVLATLFTIRYRKSRLDGFRWAFYDFSGLRAIWQKVLPRSDSLRNRRASINDHCESHHLSKYDREPASFFLWFIAVYVAFFGVASNRHENRVDIIENRANAIVAQLATNSCKKAFSRIDDVQRMECPVHPNILRPRTVFLSLFGKRCPHDPIVTLLRNIVEDWKENLEGIELNGANLHGADLSDANLLNADLQGANLQDVNLRGAILWRVDLQDANLHGADLWSARLGDVNFQRANLQDADLSGACLQDAYLQDANLRGTNLQGARNLTPSQLCQVSTLYKTQLDSDLLEAVKAQCPHLLDCPEWMQAWGLCSE